VISFAVANLKGGTGKTSISLHAGVGWALRKKRVLLIDLDPTAHATRWLLERPPEYGAADIFLEGRIDLDQLPQPRPGLWVAAGNRRLGGTDVAQKVGGARLGSVLGRALASVADKLDYAIIDCPPNVRAVELEALASVDSLVIPLDPGMMSLGGVRELEETLERARAMIHVRVAGLVLFRSDERERATRDTREILAAHRPGMLLDSEVRVSAAAKTMSSTRKTAWDKGADPRGAEDYAHLLRELDVRLRGAARKKAAK
jgi:chromosome partitioning protein